MKGSDLFINYFGDDRRDTPINFAAARIILGTYLIWRVASIDAVAKMEWPVPIATSTAIFYPDFYPPLIIIAKWVCLIAAVGFLIGYRTRTSGFIAALSLSYLATIRLMVNRAGETEELLVASYLIILFALFSQHDKLSVDELRDTATKSMAELNDHLKSDPRGTFRVPSLKWGLLMISILYFGSGLVKVLNNPGLSWGTVENQAGFITMWSFRFQREFPAGQMLQQSDLVLATIGYGTIVLELAYPLIVLMGITVAPVIAITLVMHIGIYVVLGILFLDLMIFLCMFAGYDQAYKDLVSNREIDVVYDERCYFCARSLYLFKFLDVQRCVTFYSQSDVPDKYQNREGIDFNKEMYVFTDNSVFSGYYAFQELLRQFFVTVPAALIMSFPPVAVVGERIYEHVAENRNRYFVCSYNPETEGQ